MALEEETIHARVNTGMRWLLFTSVISLVSGFGTNVILGRIAPELLGYYGYLSLTVSVLSTFFIFGGANVIVNYLPRTDSGNKVSFIFTYAFFVVLAALTFLIIAYLFPSLLRIIYGDRYQLSDTLVVITFLPMVIVQTIMWAVLQADMEFKGLAISQQIISWLNVVMFAFIFSGIVHTGLSISNEHIVYIVFLGSNVISILIGLYRFFHIYKSSWQFPKFYVPKGFWRFTVTFHLGTLLAFVILYADQLVIFRFSGFKELGFYRAAVVLAQFSVWAPQVIDRSVYSTFCNLISNKKSILEPYLKFCRINVLASSAIGMVLILFSREILYLFGKQFSDTAYLFLIILTMAKLLTAPINMVSGALLTAMQKVNVTLIGNATGAAIALILYHFLTSRFGVIGVVYGYFLVNVYLLVYVSIASWYYSRIPFPAKIYLFMLLIIGTSLLGWYMFSDLSLQNIFIKCGLAAGSIFVILKLNIMQGEDVREVIGTFLPLKYFRVGTSA
ncbi:MAG: oligosaccharide flippase family protein [Bacteroidota bacterium]